MKKFSKILEANFIDIKDMFLYIEDYINYSIFEIVYEDKEFKVQYVTFLKDIDFNHNNTDELRENIDKATEILEIMERIKRATNKNIIFTSFDYIYETSLIQIEFDVEPTFNNFLNKCEKNGDNISFRYNNYYLTFSIDINKDASAILKTNDKLNKDTLKDLVEYLSSFNIEFIETNNNNFVFKINSII